ncbi:MAG: hypothetical protein AAFZ38_05860 [Myxococcota bacterium]
MPVRVRDARLLDVLGRNPETRACTRHRWIERSHLCTLELIVTNTGAGPLLVTTDHAFSVPSLAPGLHAASISRASGLLQACLASHSKSMRRGLFPPVGLGFTSPFLGDYEAAV